MTPNSIITGFITDEAGETHPRSQSLAPPRRTRPRPTPPHRQHHHRRPRLLRVFPTSSPGDYQIAVQAQPWYAAAGRGGIRVNSLPKRPHLPAKNANRPIARPHLPPSPGFPGVITRRRRILHPARRRRNPAGRPPPHPHPIDPRPHPTKTPHPVSGSEQGGDGRRPITIPQMERLSELGPSDFRPTSVTIAPDGSLDLGGFAPRLLRPLAVPLPRRTAKPSTSPPTPPRTVEPTITTAPRRRQWTTPARTTAATSTAGTGTATAISPAPKPLASLYPVSRPSPESQPQAPSCSSSLPPPHAPHNPSRASSPTPTAPSIFARLAPGRYILIAIQNGWNLDLRKPCHPRKLPHSRPTDKPHHRHHPPPTYSQPKHPDSVPPRRSALASLTSRDHPLVSIPVPQQPMQHRTAAKATHSPAPPATPM